MPGNTIGHLFRLTSFGESHGAAIGGVLDGCPAGLELDLEAVQRELDRRRPGSTPLGTSRNEADRVEFLSGVFEIPSRLEAGMTARNDKRVTLGTPIAFLIRNADAKPSDYDALKDVYRPGHADKTWEDKFGLRDHRGGGRSSARTTAASVVAGAIARQLLATEGVHVHASVLSVGEVSATRTTDVRSLERVWQNAVRCADPDAVPRMTELIERVRAEGDSVGGVVSCFVRGLPVGLGEPVFDKLDADLAKAMLSINAVKGFQIGMGFHASTMRGSEHNKATQGGVLGGISSGEDITFDVAFKPPSTIAKSQLTTDRSGNAVTLEAKGRHDPCVVPRAVPIVEAMTCLVLADHLLRQRSARV
ncbi:MAG: chorismate synthase [Flavobacteriales bacterium]|nr:chorismate synthase [Flavobacteriales bacterium]